MDKKTAKYKIYRATNIINGKVYIGYTANLSTRKGGHKYDSKTKVTKFCNAIRKHGWEAFVWEVIFESWDKDYCLKIEKELIESYDSVSCGYNIHEGGRIGATHYHKDNGMFGRTHTDEVKKKLGLEASKRFKGKSYEELYGEEKAREMKKERSVRHTGRTDGQGKKNPRFKPAIIRLLNDDGRSFVGTQYDFGIQHPELLSGGISFIVLGRKPSYKGWRLDQTSPSKTS